MPARANRRFALVLLEANQTTCRASRCSARRSQARLVSLPLLIIIAAILTTIHCESFQFEPSSSSSSSSTSSPTSSWPDEAQSSESLLQSARIFPASSSLEFLTKAASKVESSPSKDIAGEQHFVLNHNTKGNHAILVRENTHQQLQLQQRQQQQDLYHHISQPVQSPTGRHSSRFNLGNALPDSNAQGFDQIQQHQSVLSEREFSQRPIVAETNLENADQQLRTSNVTSSDVEQEAAMQQVVGQVEINKEVDEQKLERRFGFFKKAQHSNNNNNNNNLPYSNFGPNQFYNDCERCLQNAAFSNPTQAQTSWMLEPTPSTYRHQQQPPMPMIYPIATNNVHQFTHHLSPLKNKFNKLHSFPKAMTLGGLGDSYFPSPQSYPLASSYKYRTPLSSRIAYRSQLNLPFSCIQAPIFGAPAQLINQGLPNQASLEDPKLISQVSYSGSQY